MPFEVLTAEPSRYNAPLCYSKRRCCTESSHQDAINTYQAAQRCSGYVNTDLMLRRSVLALARRPLSTMSTQTPMEDAMRRKVCAPYLSSLLPKQANADLNPSRRSQKPSNPVIWKSTTIPAYTRTIRPWQEAPPRKRTSVSLSHRKRSDRRCSPRDIGWCTPC